MLCSRGQRLLMMDADGATKVSDLERLEAKLAEICSERITWGANDLLRVHTQRTTRLPQHVSQAACC